MGFAGDIRAALRIGLVSARANVVPMVILWAMAALMVLAFYQAPAADAVFGPLAKWQTQSGWLAAFLNRVVFCGVIPGIFLLSVKSIRPPRPLLTIVVYSLWGGLWGVACDGFFTLQTAVFGAGTDVATLVKKTLVDQLVWNVFLCTPANAVFFPWAARDFRRRPRRSLRDFVQDCLVLLLANWIVWIPVTMVVYAFPLPLQIQLVGLACSFWMLVALRVGTKGRV